MRNFQQKKKWRNIVESWPVLIFLSIMLLFFAWGVVGFMRKMQTTRENRKIAEERLIELQKQKEKLSGSIDKLKTDEGKEEIFRENYALAKEGEGLIVVVDEKPAVKAEDESSGGFFSFLFFWNWFK